MYNSFESGFDERDNEEFGNFGGGCSSSGGGVFNDHSFLNPPPPPPSPNDGLNTETVTTTLLAEMQKQIIPEIKDDWIDWTVLLQSYTKCDQWTFNSQFITLHNEIDQQDLCNGDCGDTLRCIDYILRPVSLFIEQHKPITWSENLHKRLTFCDVLHAGTKSFRVKRINDSIMLRVEIYYVGWRFFFNYCM